MAPITTILAFLLPAVDVGVVAFTPQKQSFSSSSPVSPMTPHNKKRTSFGLQVFEPSAQFDATSLIGDAGKVQHSKLPAVASSGGPQIKIVPRQAEERKKWGVDNAYAQEYWFDDRIHTLGNTGLGGALHAALAPISTKCIDQFAYDGVDIRAKVRLRNHFIDFCLPGYSRASLLLYPSGCPYSIRYCRPESRQGDGPVLRGRDLHSSSSRRLSRCGEGCWPRHVATDDCDGKLP
jgi:hypothetical protein